MTNQYSYLNINLKDLILSYKHLELNQKYLKNESFGFKFKSQLVTNHNPLDLFLNLCNLECKTGKLHVEVFFFFLFFFLLFLFLFFNVNIDLSLAPCKKHAVIHCPVDGRIFCISLH